MKKISFVKWRLFKNQKANYFYFLHIKKLKSTWNHTFLENY